MVSAQHFQCQCPCLYPVCAAVICAFGCVGAVRQTQNRSLNEISLRQFMHRFYVHASRRHRESSASKWYLCIGIGAAAVYEPESTMHLMKRRKRATAPTAVEPTEHVFPIRKCKNSVIIIVVVGIIDERDAHGVARSLVRSL